MELECVVVYQCTVISIMVSLGKDSEGGMDPGEGSGGEGKETDGHSKGRRLKEGR